MDTNLPFFSWQNDLLSQIVATFHVLIHLADMDTTLTYGSVQTLTALGSGVLVLPVLFWNCFPWHVFHAFTLFCFPPVTPVFDLVINGCVYTVLSLLCCCQWTECVLCMHAASCMLLFSQCFFLLSFSWTFWAFWLTPAFLWSELLLLLLLNHFCCEPVSESALGFYSWVPGLFIVTHVTVIHNECRP